MKEAYGNARNNSDVEMKNISNGLVKRLDVGEKINNTIEDIPLENIQNEMQRKIS